jgi:hypothetical protein
MHGRPCEGMTVTIKDELHVPDWQKRIARLKEAAEGILEHAKAVEDATKGTLFENDGIDIARQLKDLVCEEHDGNSVMDLVQDIIVMEGVEICQKSKSSSAKVR